MDERPWWHPSRDDECDEPLPTVVILEPDYGAELPLTSEEGMLGWQQTGFSPQLLDQLATWQEAFEVRFHFDTGWRSRQLRDEWATQASHLEAAIRAELGSRAELVVLQETEPEPGLSVRECLALYAGFYCAPRDIDETIALAGLSEKAGALGARLSGGQRRRLDFALALIGDPELIFLDEPTTGFDPSARRAAWEVIAGLRQLGKTVFLTTHDLDEAEYLADRITVLSAGRIVAAGTPQTLGGRDRMTTDISFTLPGHVQARDLPPELFPLSEPGAGGSTILHSETPLVARQS
jgi:ABC-type lipoprotein export system ATPase subunit